MLGLGVGLEKELKIVLKHGLNPQKIAILILKTDFGYLSFTQCQADRLGPTYLVYIYRRGKWADLRLFLQYLAEKQFISL